METDILIIGGGAAGMLAAIGASGNGASSVTIIEKMPRPGRKIMISGKGRCNITNLKKWQDFSQHIHPKADFIKPAFFSFSPDDTVKLLNENGLHTVTERGDRVFPSSYRAMDVVDTLQKTVKRAGAKLLANEEAVRISRNGDGFTVMTASGKEIHTGKLIIATGGLSYPATGSTGDGYTWAAGLGHKIRQCFPSLTAIVPAGYKTVSCKSSAQGHIDRTAPLTGLGKSLAGNSLKNISLTVMINGDIAAEEFGDMDFTDGGIEGPIGFKVSRKCVKAIMNGSKTVVSLDLKPAVESDVLERRINSLTKDIEADPRSRNKSADAKFRVLLGKLMPGTLIDGFLKCNRDAGTDNLAGLLKNWEFPVAGYVGYERCVVTAGGVSTDEVSAKTMESKLVPGLYFAGEVLDIDGDTGGYNLQCAFSTGFLAGRSAAASRSSRA